MIAVLIAIITAKKCISAIPRRRFLLLPAMVARGLRRKRSTPIMVMDAFDRSFTVFFH